MSRANTPLSEKADCLDRPPFCPPGIQPSNKDGDSLSVLLAELACQALDIMVYELVQDLSIRWRI